MRTKAWKRLLVIGVIGGSFLFQTQACVERAAFTTAVSSVITAGGVLFIVDRIVND